MTDPKLVEKAHGIVYMHNGHSKIKDLTCLENDFADALQSHGDEVRRKTVEELEAQLAKAKKDAERLAEALMEIARHNEIVGDDSGCTKCEMVSKKALAQHKEEK